MRTAKNPIPVKMFRTILAGYTGFLDALLRYKHGRLLLVSERGIYTERCKIDLFRNQ